MSNQPNYPFDRNEAPLEGQLPPELAAVAAALDALAAADRAAASPGTERRVFAATQAKLAGAAAAGVAPEDAALDQLAELDRRAARPTLEDRIFMASRASLGRRRESAPLRVVFRRPLVRVAAGLLVAAGIGAAYLALRPSNTVSRPSPASLTLEQRMDREMQQLSAVLQVAFSDTLPGAGPVEGEGTQTGEELNIESLLNGLGTGEDSL